MALTFGSILSLIATENTYFQLDYDIPLVANTMAINADSRYLAIYSDQTILPSVFIVNTATGHPVRELYLPTLTERAYGQASWIGMSTDGRYVALVLYVGGICVWDLEDETVHPLWQREISVGATCAAFGMSDGQLAVGEVGGTVSLWDTRSGHLDRRFQAHSLPANAVPAGNTAVKAMSGPINDVCAITFSCDRSMFATASLLGDIQLWNDSGESLYCTHEAIGRAMLNLTFSYDQTNIIGIGTLQFPPGMYCWDYHINTLSPQSICMDSSREYGTAVRVAASSSGEGGISVCYDRSLCIWSYDPDLFISAARGFEPFSGPRCMAISDDMKTCITGHADRVAVWRRVELSQVR